MCRVRVTLHTTYRFVQVKNGCMQLVRGCAQLAWHGASTGLAMIAAFRAARLSQATAVRPEALERNSDQIMKSALLPDKRPTDKPSTASSVPSYQAISAFFNLRGSYPNLSIKICNLRQGSGSNRSLTSTWTIQSSKRFLKIDMGKTSTSMCVAFAIFRRKTLSINCAELSANSLSGRDEKMMF